MNLDFYMKHKILYLILSAILATFFSGMSEEYTRIHIELPNQFVVEYENNISQK